VKEANKYMIEYKMQTDGAGRSKTTEENDNVSHFICRLAYCRNDELRKWFINQETRLFNIRLKMLPESEVKSFLEDRCKINYESCSPNDPVWVKRHEDIAFMSAKADARPENYVKVPFKEAISLIGKRHVFLHQGIAYVPLKELYSIVSAHFKAKLFQEMIKAYKHYP
jgi:DNA primase large subunit